MKIRNYVKPSSLEEVYEFVSSGGTIIGGGAWLKLMPKTIDNAVDISDLDLDYIKVVEGTIQIGSMTTLRSIETNEAIQGYMTGVISEAASHIMGVTVRNIATIGGSVVNRFGFSDLLTPLLAVGASLEFYHHGSITLEAYLDKPFKEKDLLVKIVLPASSGVAAYKTLKKTSTDFPMLNASVARIDGKYRVSVGARPGPAKLATKTMLMLDEATLVTPMVLENIHHMIGEELSYGSNSRGSALYRTELAKALVERCIKEVL